MYPVQLTLRQIDEWKKLVTTTDSDLQEYISWELELVQSAIKDFGLHNTVHYFNQKDATTNTDESD